MNHSGKRLFSLAYLIMALSIIPGCGKREPVDMESLLREMIDKSMITYFPDPHYTIKQFSSYNRQTVSPGQPGWWANQDATFFIREEYNDGRKEYVMFDAEGPGAIVRFWLTLGGDGATDNTIRFYLDGNPQPVIEDNVLKVISGWGAVGKPLSVAVPDKGDHYYKGHNLYLPIPYRKRCKITLESDSIKIDEENKKRTPWFFYNINYRTYATGTGVVSFSPEQLAKQKPLLAKVSRELLSPEPLQEISTFKKQDSLQPGENTAIRVAERGTAISGIQMKLAANDLPQAFRSTVLEMSFDGLKTVWIPLGDFFGTGYLISPFQTWFSKTEIDGTLQTTWIMPFKRNCSLSVINHGEQEVNVKVEISTTKYKWRSNSLYFASSWHEYRDLNTFRDDPVDAENWHFDINFVTINGTGVYAGDGITLFNPVNSWWGEGDEKIFVDGESFPSNIGTGTEDYFGYAWGTSETFSHPFIAQPLGKGNVVSGVTVNMRHRSLDAIPFRSRIQADIEMHTWIKQSINYALYSYWYVSPGATWNIKPDPAAVKKTVISRLANPYESNVDDSGKLEGEALDVIEVAKGNAVIEKVPDVSGLSNNEQLFWASHGKGDTLTVAFEVEKEGNYEITGKLSRSYHYGIATFRVNGHPVEHPFDGYHGERIASFPFDFGTFLLKEGENRITITLTGRNKKSAGSYFGIDVLYFKRNNT